MNSDFISCVVECWILSFFGDSQNSRKLFKRARRISKKARRVSLSRHCKKGGIYSFSVVSDIMADIFIYNSYGTCFSARHCAKLWIFRSIVSPKNLFRQKWRNLKKAVGLPVSIEGQINCWEVKLFAIRPTLWMWKIGSGDAPRWIFESVTEQLFQNENQKLLWKFERIFSSFFQKNIYSTKS